MKKFGLIGDPIAHSLSPALFRAGYGLEAAKKEGTKGKNVNGEDTGTESKPWNGSKTGIGTEESQKYSYGLIEGADFETSYREFLYHYDGVNVTAPFKELAFAKADIKSPECGKIGATNLLVKTSEGIKAYNSDYYGIILPLLTHIFPDKNPDELLSAFNRAEYHKMDTANSPEEQKNKHTTANRSGQQEDSRTTDNLHEEQESRQTDTTKKAINGIFGRQPSALIVGCGGAGKAAAVAAGDLGFSTTLMNRTIKKAEAIAKALPEYGFKTKPLGKFARCFSEADIIIYTLPRPFDKADEIFGTGLKEQPRSIEDRPGTIFCSPKTEPSHGATSPQHKIILEANYRDPAFTEDILKNIKAAHPGSVYISGKDWLLYQAYTGYSLFTGETPDLSAMQKIIHANN